jgi:hypothetical protein
MGARIFWIEWASQSCPGLIRRNARSIAASDQAGGVASSARGTSGIFSGAEKIFCRQIPSQRCRKPRLILIYGSARIDANFGL